MQQSRLVRVLPLNTGRRGLNIILLLMRWILCRLRSWLFTIWCWGLNINLLLLLFQWMTLLEHLNILLSSWIFIFQLSLLLMIRISSVLSSRRSFMSLFFLTQFVCRSMSLRRWALGRTVLCQLLRLLIFFMPRCVSMMVWWALLGAFLVMIAALFLCSLVC